MLFLINSLFELSPTDVFAILLALFVVLCLSLSVHEFAHAYTAYKCGDDTAKMAGRMTLNPFSHISFVGFLFFLIIGFGWAKPVPINPAKFRSYKKHSVLVLVSGVLANFILAFIFYGMLHFFCFLPITAIEGNVLMLFFYWFLYFGFMVNICLFIFNLLPIPPLDGFNLLSVFTKWENKFVQFLSQYGFLIFILFIIPFFNGNSIIDYVFQYLIPLFEKFFLLFWGIF